MRREKTLSSFRVGLSVRWFGLSGLPLGLFRCGFPLGLFPLGSSSASGFLCLDGGGGCWMSFALHGR